MRMMLLAAAAGLAAIALPAPAAAQGTASHDEGSEWRDGVNFRDGGRDGDRRRRHRGSDTVLVYDRDWQGHSAWRANSFNDWWHERPHRAFPRWVADNQDCRRLWQSGGVWRC